MLLTAMFFMPIFAPKKHNKTTMKDFNPTQKFDKIEHNGLEVRNLNIHIGDVHILKDVNVTIPKNKITCIIGPSGCGKSTLLRTFNRIIDTTEGVKIDGDVLFGNHNIVKSRGSRLIELRRHIGLVP
jgi:phosphate transport system ATP-binding protein